MEKEIQKKIKDLKKVIQKAGSEALTEVVDTLVFLVENGMLYKLQERTVSPLVKFIVANCQDAKVIPLLHRLNLRYPKFVGSAFDNDICIMNAITGNTREALFILVNNFIQRKKIHFQSDPKGLFIFPSVNEEETWNQAISILGYGHIEDGLLAKINVFQYGLFRPFEILLKSGLEGDELLEWGRVRKGYTNAVKKITEKTVMDFIDSLSPNLISEKNNK